MFFRSVEMESVKAYVFGVREDQGKINFCRVQTKNLRLCGTRSKYLKLRVKKLKKFGIKKALLRFPLPVNQRNP
jgi:hypothetical protein